MLRVTLAAPEPISDALLAIVGDVDVHAGPASFGHVAHALVEHDDPEALRAKLRDASQNAAVGVIDGALAEEHAQILMLDVDSTLTTTEAIDLLAEHAGRGDEVAAITEAAMRGELDFEQSLRQRVATLKGLPTSIFDEVQPRMTLSPGAQDLLEICRRRGVKVGVTSGGFNQLVGPLAEQLRLDFFHANELETVVRDGQEQLTGGVIGTIVDRAQKSRDLREFAARFDVPLSHAVAVGDGANDLTMLATAALGIAYCAKPTPAAQADVAIPFPRLDAVAAFAFPDHA